MLRKRSELHRIEHKNLEKNQKSVEKKLIGLLLYHESLDKNQEGVEMKPIRSLLDRKSNSMILLCFLNCRNIEMKHYDTEMKC